jgi:ABC-type sugar transport system substrate-binding protein
MKKIGIWLVIVAVVVTMAFVGIACKATTAATTAAAETTVAATTAAATTAAAETTAAATTAAAPKKLKVGYGYTYGTHPVVAEFIKAGNAVLNDPKWTMDGKYQFEIVQADAGWEDVDAKLTTVLEDLYAQKLDGLLVFSGGTGLPPGTPIKELFNKNNIPVALQDYIAYIKDVDYVCWAGSDMAKAGGKAYTEAKKYLKSGDEVICIGTYSTDPTSLLRSTGYETPAKADGMKVVPLVRAESATIEIGQKLTEDALTANPDLKAIDYTDGLLALGGLQALKGLGLEGKVFLTCNGANEPLYKQISSGAFVAATMMDYHGIGAIPAEGLMLTLTGQPVPKKDNPTESNILNGENFKDFANDPTVQPAKS